MGEGGSGDTPGHLDTRFGVKVRAGYQPKRFYLLGFVLSMLLAVFFFHPRHTFEKKRWAEVIEDDDDDDDDW